MILNKPIVLRLTIKVLMEVTKFFEFFNVLNFVYCKLVVWNKLNYIKMF